MGMQEEWEERLTDSGRPKEIDDEPRALALDKVVDVVRLGERASGGASCCPRGGRDLRGVFIPLDGEDFGHVEFDWRVVG
jgi:hypothetical protein